MLVCAVRARAARHCNAACVLQRASVERTQIHEHATTSICATFLRLERHFQVAMRVHKKLRGSPLNPTHEHLAFFLQQRRLALDQHTYYHPDLPLQLAAAPQWPPLHSGRPWRRPASPSVRTRVAAASRMHPMYIYCCVASRSARIWPSLSRDPNLDRPSSALHLRSQAAACDPAGRACRGRGRGCAQGRAQEGGWPQARLDGAHCGRALQQRCSSLGASSQHSRPQRSPRRTLLSPTAVCR